MAHNDGVVGWAGRPAGGVAGAGGSRGDSAAPDYGVSPGRQPQKYEPALAAGSVGVSEALESEAWRCSIAGHEVHPCRCRDAAVGQDPHCAFDARRRHKGRLKVDSAALFTGGDRDQRALRDGCRSGVEHGRVGDRRASLGLPCVIGRAATAATALASAR